MAATTKQKNLTGMTPFIQKVMSWEECLTSSSTQGSKIISAMPYFQIT